MSRNYYIRFAALSSVFKLYQLFLGIPIGMQSTKSHSTTCAVHCRYVAARCFFFFFFLHSELGCQLEYSLSTPFSGSCSNRLSTIQYSEDAMHENVVKKKDCDNQHCIRTMDSYPGPQRKGMDRSPDQFEHTITKDGSKQCCCYYPPFKQ